MTSSSLPGRDIFAYLTLLLRIIFHESPGLYKKKIKTTHQPLAPDMTPATEADLLALPSPSSITLLLKNHKQTVLLSVHPDTPFPEIKSLLRAALQARDVTAIDGTPVPNDAEDVEFGVLRNKKNPAEGWVALDDDVKETDGGDAKGGKRKGKESASNETPAGAGLVDGSMLAFRFRTRLEGKGEEEQEDEDDRMQTKDDPGWNVVLPSYDDEQ